MGSPRYPATSANLASATTTSTLRIRKPATTSAASAKSAWTTPTETLARGVSRGFSATPLRPKTVKVSNIKKNLHDLYPHICWSTSTRIMVCKFASQTTEGLRDAVKSAGQVRAIRDRLSGLFTNSILFCWLFKIEDRCKQVRFQQTHNYNQGLRQLF